MRLNRLYILRDWIVKGGGHQVREAGYLECSQKNKMVKITEMLHKIRFKKKWNAIKNLMSQKINVTDTEF